MNTEILDLFLGLTGCQEFETNIVISHPFRFHLAWTYLVKQIELEIPWTSTWPPIYPLILCIGIKATFKRFSSFLWVSDMLSFKSVLGVFRFGIFQSSSQLHNEKDWIVLELNFHVFRFYTICKEPVELKKKAL